MEDIKNATGINLRPTPDEINQHRLKLRNISGMIYGRQVVSVKSDNIDLKYKENAKNGLNQLKCPIKKYFIETVDVTSLDLSKSPDGSICIIINGRADLKFPLCGDDPKLTNATQQDVLNAMADYDQNKTVQFFTDYELVKDTVVSENKRHAKFLEDLANEFLNESGALDNINTIEEQNFNRYAKSLE